MRNLAVFILKHHFLLLFLVLQGFCISIIVQNNEPQKSNFISTSNEVFAKIFSVNQAITEYFNLATINKTLAEENARLYKNQLLSKLDKSVKDTTIVDTLLEQQYEYMMAQVVNNSTHRTHNYITLNKGWRQGIEPNMAVICSKGIVGIVTNVSQNYSTVMSVLHAQFKISAKFKKTNFFGSLYWDSKDYQIARLTEIPFHVKFKKGDTLVTNEFSNVYPGNIMIGTIKEFNKVDDDNFYSIDVKLSTDFKQLEYVYVVKNLFKKEKESLESLSQ